MNKKVRQLVGIYSVIAGMTLAGLAPQAPVRAEAEVATGGAINQPSDTAEPAVTPTPTVTPTQTPAASDQKKDNWTVKLKKCSHPKKITKGAGFKVKGTLKASKKMKTVKASILNEEGDSVCTKKIKVNKKNCSLAKVDKSMKFGKLKEGSYSYVVEATNTSRNKKTVIDDDFTVKKENGPVLSKVATGVMDGTVVVLPTVADIMDGMPEAVEEPFTVWQTVQSYMPSIMRPVPKHLLAN